MFAARFWWMRALLPPDTGQCKRHWSAPACCQTHPLRTQKTSESRGVSGTSNTLTDSWFSPGHGVHEVAPLREYVPALQTVHEKLPGTFL